MKLLLVEDHPLLAEVSCEVLRNHYGHEVVHASSGREALRLAAATTPDIVLLDLLLPDMHGYEIAKALRRLPGGNLMILVALTGFKLTGNESRSLAAGLDAHFRKPMDFGELCRLRRSSSVFRPTSPPELRAKKISKGAESAIVQIAQS